MAHIGAQVLGRRAIGHLAVGLCADLALFDLETIAFAGGAVHDPVGALVLCASAQAAYRWSMDAWSCALAGSKPSSCRHWWRDTTHWPKFWLPEHANRLQ